MAKPDTIIIDGRALSWARLVELRCQQLEAWRAEQCRQLAVAVLTLNAGRAQSWLRISRTLAIAA